MQKIISFDGKVQRPKYFRSAENAAAVFTSFDLELSVTD